MSSIQIYWPSIILQLVVSFGVLYYLTLFLFFPVSVYASLCRDDNGSVTIDGTPMPELHYCEPIVESNSESVISTTNRVRVNSNQPANPQPPHHVITVVVTATPALLPTSTVHRITKPYKAIPTGTLTPTAVATPSPTVKPMPKNTTQPQKQLFLETLRIKVASLFSFLRHIL